MSLTYLLINKKIKMYKILKNKKNDKSEIELEISISKDVVQSKHKDAIKYFSEHANIDGFRKGHIPENIIIKNIGELSILEEAVEIAIKDIYSKIIDELKINPLTYPQITITKIAKDIDTECQIKIPVLPEIKLPDYKALAKKENSKEEKVSVDNKEVEEVINELIKHKGEENINLDDLAKSLGQFKDAEDLKNKIKENIQNEKEYKAKHKKRIDILEAINKKIDVNFPDVLIENELERMKNEIENELEKSSTSFEKYLKEINKTEAELKTEWNSKAKERVLNEFILVEISKAENLKLEEEEVKKEVEHLLEHYKDATEDRVRLFVEDVLMKEKVFKFLEEQK